MSALRQRLRWWAPPALADAVRRLRGNGIRFTGDYADWRAAAAASTGYGADVIFERSRDAALKVKRGEAVFERDGVLFDHVQYSLPVMAALLRVALANGGRLSVLDFGGGFGSSFRQFRSFLDEPQPRLCWSIVDQPRIVECGRREFADERLHFYNSIAECMAHEQPDVVLLSSVLQYLEAPYGLIDEIGAALLRYLVIDRTPCSAIGHDVLCIQKVPGAIYRASYPCWIFSRKRLLSALQGRYRLLAKFSEQGEAWRSEHGEFTLDCFLLDLQSPN
jgi:putative methyltransferase (TIGR04325 family)